MKVTTDSQVQGGLWLARTAAGPADLPSPAAGPATQTLSAMPGVWAAFDRADMSWSQLRGILGAAEPLNVVDRHTLDGLLAAAIVQNGQGEPDRLVEVAQDWAVRLADDWLADREQADSRRVYLSVQGCLGGGADVRGFLDEGMAATLSEALDAVADPPQADRVRVDANGRPVPAAWGPPTTRQAQLAEALVRLADRYLTGPTPGGSARARNTALVVVDIRAGSGLSDAGV